MIVKLKKTLDQRLTEDVTALTKANAKLKKDKDSLEKRIVKLERAVRGLLQSNTHILSLYNRLQQSMAQCNNELQSLRRKT